MTLSSQAWAAIIFASVVGAVVILPALMTWGYAASRGVDLSPFSAACMRFRKVKPRSIVDAVVRLRDLGYQPEIAMLEAHYMVMGQLRTLVEVAERHGGELEDYAQVAAKDIESNSSDGIDENA